jgi:hypothetical protein
MARNYRSSVPRGQTVYIVKGGLIGSIQTSQGIHTPADIGKPEWQFSDGPAGERGSSADYADLLHGLEDHAGCIFNIDDADFNEAENALFCGFVAARGQLRNKFYVGQAPLHIVTSYRETDSALGSHHARKGWHWHFSVTLPTTYDGQQCENGYIVQGPFDTEADALANAHESLTDAYHLPMGWDNHNG